MRLTATACLVFLMLSPPAFAQDTARPAVSATLIGVVTDTAGRPLENATVTLDALRLITRADARGEFRLAAIPLGTHLITARAIGYEPGSLTIDFPVGGERSRTFALRLTRTTLDSVEVKAKRFDPRMEEFEEHRRLGLGHFLTSAELRKSEGQRLSSLLAMVPGLALVNGRANHAWILSKRRPGAIGASRCEPWDADSQRMGRPAAGGSVYIPSRAEMSMGITCACYAQVYLDGRLMNPGMPSDPFDVNSFPTHQLEAIEYYASPSQTPSKYSRLNSPCGVYVMHTRRPEGD